jgi:hypothetical protein
MCDKVRYVLRFLFKQMFLSAKARSSIRVSGTHKRYPIDDIVNWTATWTNEVGESDRNGEIVELALDLELVQLYRKLNDDKKRKSVGCSDP